MRPRDLHVHLTILVAAALAFGCATKRPVLYPNQHLRSVSEEQARWDVEDCMRLTKEGGVRTGTETAPVGDAVGSATAGGAAGAAAGAVYKGASAGRAAAAGAAGAGANSLVRSMLYKKDPAPAYKGFVDRCLQERGYDPIGWQ